MLKNNTEEVLRRYYLASVNAEENPKLMLDGAPDALDICSARMEELADAETELFKLNWPPLVVLFKHAADNLGCAQCRFSSRSHIPHAECDEKNRRYFGYREGLLAYLKEVYIRGKDVGGRNTGL